MFEIKHIQFRLCIEYYSTNKLRPGCDKTLGVGELGVRSGEVRSDGVRGYGVVISR